MTDVVVIGAGEIGTTLVGVLAATNDYQVTLVGRSADALSWLRQGNCISYRVVDVEDSSRAARIFHRRACTTRLQSSGRYFAESFP
jgi:saccharopine dehydrogenase-like NADP-dependent oxidoreductase